MKAMRAQHSNFEPVSPPTIAALVTTRLVRLPAWFTLGQALRVADLRGVEHVLVEEQGRVRGSVSRAVLAAQSPADTLARWVRRSDLFASPDMDVAAAAAAMHAEGVTCLPVASRGLLVGTVSLTDLRQDAGTPAAVAA
jgi:CBS domain-containing protein